MATKERIIELVVSLPDTPETESRLDDIEHKLEPNGAGASEEPVEEGPIPTLEESFEILGSVDFPPREDAWR